MTWARWLPLLAIVLLSGFFAYLNGEERITLNLGFTIYYRVRLVPIVFGAFILGMIAMFLLGLRHDMQVRRALREHHLLRDPYPTPPEPEPPPDSS